RRGDTPLRDRPAGDRRHGHLFPRATAMTRLRLPAVLVVGVLMGAPVAGGHVAAAVEPPSIDGPVPAGGPLGSDSVRTGDACRTTAAVLDPGAPPASRSEERRVGKEAGPPGAA